MISKKLKASVIISFAILSANSYAGACNKASLSGLYNYHMLYIDPTEADHHVGRLSFNGAGSVSLNGIVTYKGISETRSGTGTYSVSAACVATGTINISTGPTAVTFWAYLDQMDYSLATNLAYHGALAIKTNRGDSASGEIDRVQGKF
jgi:hypothetical protein